MANKSSFGMIFDLSFTEFVTTHVIKVLFVIGVIFAGLSSLGIIIAGFADGAASGIFALLLAPIVFMIYVLLIRIWCELIVVIFRIAENTSKIADNTGSLTDQLKL